tara:strand:+ start:11293 stop:11898 length:606 start_codon:yes stop_codon:yes gene_type:complete
MEETDKLFGEDVSFKDNCNLCNEQKYEVGEKTEYGVIIYKIGSQKNGWFATLSPKTGGNAKDFTIQLMPFSHLTHFSQIESHKGLAESYGIAFSKLSMAMTRIMIENEGLKSTTKEKKLSVPIATYGKSTTWKEKKEHLHIKIFPFRGNIGQPYTVDSSFGRKEIFKDKTGEFVKMNPVKKVMIGEERFEKLVKDLISLLK